MKKKQKLLYLFVVKAIIIPCGQKVVLQLSKEMPNKKDH